MVLLKTIGRQPVSLALTTRSNSQCLAQGHFNTGASTQTCNLLIRGQPLYIHTTATTCMSIGHNVLSASFILLLLFVVTQ